MGFGLWPSGVHFGFSGLSNEEQLVSPDNHFLHLKGVVVFHQSTFLLCSKTFMVMSPHFLVILTNPFQLSLHPETAFAQSIGSPYPLLVPLAGSLYWHFICVWVCNTVSGGCFHVRVIHILPWWVRIWWGLIPSTPQAICSCPIIRVSNGPGWTGRGRLGGSCSHCSELGPASGISSDMLSLPCVELWLLLTLTSWELTQVLLPQWRSNELLERQPCFFCEEMARNSANGCPTREVPIKGRSGKRGMIGGGVSERWAGLLEGPGVVDSSGLGAVVVAGAFSSSTWWPPMPHLYSKKGPKKKCTRAVPLLILTDLPWQKPLGRLCFLPEPLSLTSTCVFTSLIHWSSSLQASFWACSPSLHSGWALAWLKHHSYWRAGL